MELLTPEIHAKLPVIRWDENKLDVVAQVKFYIPGANWTWFLAGFDGGDSCCGLERGPYEEVGSIYLSAMRHIAEDLGREIKQDFDFTPTPVRRLLRKIPAGHTHYNRALIKSYVDQVDVMKIQDRRELSLESLTQNIAVLLSDDPDTYSCNFRLSEYVRFLVRGDSEVSDLLPPKKYQELIKSFAALSVNKKFTELGGAIADTDGTYDTTVWEDMEIELYGVVVFEWEKTHLGEPRPPLKPRYQLISQYNQQS